MIIQKSAGTASESGSAPEITRFVFHGHASGFAGRVIRVDDKTGLNHVSPVQAACTLPVIGGRAECVVDQPYSHRITSPRSLDLFQFRYTRTSAAGEPQTNGWRTRVEADLQGLQILGGLISVEKLNAALDGEFRREDTTPRITPSSDCAIAGLTLEGFPVEVTLNLEPFQSAPTFAQLRELSLKDPSFTCYGKPLPEGRVGECHIIRKIEFPKGLPKGAVLAGPNHIRWEGVGSIFLGELLAGQASRRLTLFRVAMGSPVEGDCTGDDIETNGHRLP